MHPLVVLASAVPGSLVFHALGAKSPMWILVGGVVSAGYLSQYKLPVLELVGAGVFYSVGVLADVGRPASLGLALVGAYAGSYVMWEGKRGPLTKGWSMSEWPRWGPDGKFVNSEAGEARLTVDPDYQAGHNMPGPRTAPPRLDKKAMKFPYVPYHH